MHSYEMVDCYHYERGLLPLFMVFSFILLVSFSSLAQSNGQGAIIANNII